jgi:hypothetical protein
MQQQTVQVGDFSVQIYTNRGYANLIPNSYAHFFQLADNTEYSVVVKNNGQTKCDASIDIDGENIGRWRIEAGASGNIVHPMTSKRKFVFKNASKFSYADGPNGSYPQNGKVSVTFYPEMKSESRPTVKVQSYIQQNDNMLKGKNGMSLDLSTNHQSGSTVLGDMSTVVDPDPVQQITSIDNARVTTVETCLVITN